MSAVLLLSGGIDSTALAFQERPALCLTVDYGQLAAQGELRAARAVCGALRLDHRELTVPIAELASGAMAGRGPSLHSAWPEFWPFRNQLLVTYAATLALLAGHQEVLIGTVATDSRHLDGSVEFVEALTRTLALQEGQVRLRAPAHQQTTEALVRRSGIGLDVLGFAHSCHVSDFACGLCAGCTKHSRVMQALGVDR